MPAMACSSNWLLESNLDHCHHKPNHESFLTFIVHPTIGYGRSLSIHDPPYSVHTSQHTSQSTLSTVPRIGTTRGFLDIHGYADDPECCIYTSQDIYLCTHRSIHRSWASLCCIIAVSNGEREKY